MAGITTAEIARIANVSQTTVSFVLSGKAKERRISQTTVEKVKKIADEYGWTTNYAATTLLSGKSKTIGIIMVNILGKERYEMVERMIMEIEERGYRSLIRITTGRTAREEQALIDMQAYNCEGFIMNTANYPGKIDRVDTIFKKNRIPYVCVGYPQAGSNHYVGADDVNAMITLLNYAYSECGRRTFIYVPQHSISTSAIDRKEGFDRFLEEHPDVRGHVIAEYPPGQYEEKKRLELAQPIAEHIDLLLKQRPAAPAIIGYGDAVVAELIPMLLKKGYRFPEDAMLAGFGNHEYDTFIHPHLTSVSSAPETIASEAISLLFDIIEHEDRRNAARNILVPSQLVIRESLCPPSAEAEDASLYAAAHV